MQKILSLALALALANGNHSLAAQGTPVHAGNPQVSPDGKHILFTSRRDGAGHSFVMDANGSGSKQLFEGEPMAWAPTWVPRSDEIIYVAPRDANDNMDIVIARMDGSGRRVLATGPDAGWPQVSPDGQHVAFNSGLFPIVAVQVVNRDGTEGHSLTPELKHATEPAWSPDGTRIVFVVAESSTAGRWTSSSIFVMKADGSDKKLVTHVDGVAQRPSWSRDGRRLAFQLATPDLKDIQVYVADIATGQSHSITPHAAAQKFWDETPSWMPDSRRIVFGSNRDGQMELYVMSADGSAQRRLTF